MPEQLAQLGGLHTTIVEPAGAGRADVVLLHGYAMAPAALAPFAHSLALPLRFLLPQAPHAAESGGFTWWPVDVERRGAALAQGPRDLADTYPQGRRAARLQLRQFLQAARAQSPERPLILCGFSQGGMLACDTVLIDGLRVDALALLSACRIAIAEWQTHRQRLHDLPVLLSHGTEDDNLAFSAGEALRDFLLAAGAKVTWMPFDAGHVVPLVVWRQLKRTLQALI
jgi:phospholipase/carboxylesterase